MMPISQGAAGEIREAESLACRGSAGAGHEPPQPAWAGRWWLASWPPVPVKTADRRCR